MEEVQSHVVLIDHLPAESNLQDLHSARYRRYSPPQEGFRAVSRYTEDFPGKLRPGESLGVHLGLIQESLTDEGGKMMVTVR